MTETPFVDSGFVAPMFSPRDDPIACLNKAMAFLMAVASLRFPTTNNQLRTSSNLRNKLLFKMAGQELLNATTANVKDIWLGNALSLSDQGMLHVKLRQSFLTMLLSRLRISIYDSDYDYLSNAQAVLMANISNYGFDVISEAQQVSVILSVIEQMSVQMINHVNNWEKANKEQNNELITAKLERYKERVKTFEHRLNIDLSSHEKMIDSQMDDMIREKLAHTMEQAAFS
ncbi:hypothetical protein Tco_0760596 [Tanacetum coccineum]